MNRILYCSWGFLYALCVGLGTLQQPAGILKLCLVVLALLFFVPGGLLLYNAIAQGDRKAVLRIRWICIGSLVLTTLSLVAFFLCAGLLQEVAVDILYDILLLVSAPMICSQYWMLSLFLWAVLLCCTFVKKSR